VIVMFAGPFMNLVLAVVIFFGVAMLYGFQTQTTQVAGVQKCVIAQSEKRQTCAPGDPVSPAQAAGLKVGDKIVAFDGRKVDDWGTLSDRIRDTIGPATLTVQRGGHQQVLHATLLKNTVAAKDSAGQVVPDKFVPAGYLGFAARTEIVPLSFGQSADRMGSMVEDSVARLVDLPAKIPGLWDAAFEGAPRAADSPVGVVGAARLGGEVMTLNVPAESQIAMLLFLLAGFNLSLFLFNMVPLLPLDGGHIAGALWEALRRHTARIFSRPDPGPFDVAKLMPVAYVVAGLFVCFTALVLIADVVNPVKIT
jgi:membrane-associated protease RseP (regulator of RpoE activity)